MSANIQWGSEMLSFLLPTLLGAFALSVMGSNSNAEESEPTDGAHRDDQNGSGKVITLETATDGAFVGGEGNDTISVNVEAPTRLELVVVEPSTNPIGDSSFAVGGGVGDDVLVLSGEGYTATGDEGNDLIYLGDATSVDIFAGEGDTVVGGSGDNVFVLLSVDAVFQGGDGADYIQSSSSSGADLGEGNDTFLGFTHSTMLSDAFPEVISGDQGDDILVGGIEEFHLNWAHGNDQGLVSFSQQVLNGGAGDDTIIGSHGDTLIGGDGQDRFEVVMNNGADSEAVSVLDFIRGHDFLELRYGSGDGYDFDPNFSDSIVHSGFQIVETSEGDTVISAHPNTVLLRLVGVTKLLVGVSEWDPTSSTYVTVDLSGSPMSTQSCDILITGHSSLTDL